MRYDPDTGAQLAQIVLPASGRSVVVDFGKVWVAAASAPELYVIDPSTNRVAATIPIHAPSHQLAFAIGAIWVGYDTEGRVEMIDGALEEIKWTAQTGVTDMESDGDITGGAVAAMSG